jgi:hypothetical protein
MRTKLFACVMIVALFSACSLFRSGPAATVIAFFHAVDDGELDKSIDYVSQAFVAQMGRQKLTGALGEMQRQIKSRGGIASITTDAETVTGETAEVRSTIHFKNGTSQPDRTKLQKENGTWRIAPSK